MRRAGRLTLLDALGYAALLALLVLCAILACSGCGDDGEKRGAHLLRVDQTWDGGRTETWRLPSGRIGRLWIPPAGSAYGPARWLSPGERTPR